MPKQFECTPKKQTTQNEVGKFFLQPGKIFFSNILATVGEFYNLWQSFFANHFSQYDCTIT